MQIKLYYIINYNYYVNLYFYIVKSFYDTIKKKNKKKN